jgi:hypothetical protein
MQLLPGQYFDKETNTHYNDFRDYDPAQGRYVQWMINGTHTSNKTPCSTSSVPAMRVRQLHRGAPHQPARRRSSSVFQCRKQGYGWVRSDG